jgi:NADH-quinone oxidoreductase subunit L
MNGDPGAARYFAEAALFTASMLGLIYADNLLQLFIFWELVGLCSYLLIGFWYRKPSAAAAAKKAFLTTRVGDVLFLTGIILLYNNLASLNLALKPGEYLLQFPVIYAHLAEIPPAQLTLIALGLLGGAVGKSGQFPLHVWLPDAMEGPTTVSAMIHAATMVTAGVYLVARMFPLFYAAPHSLRYQEGAGLLDRLSIGLYDGGSRNWCSSRHYGCRSCHVPPHRPFVLQGPALPRRRLSHPRSQY